jgi:O-antigen/teichoic acid export membrane protein
MKEKKRRTSKDIFIYTIGNTLQQLVGFIMLPIYTTYLKPADYGIVAMLTLSIAIFEIALGARFAQAIPRFYYDVESQKARNAVLSTALSITALISFIGVLIIWSGQSTVSEILFGSKDGAIYVSVFSVLLFTTGIERYGMTYLRLLEKPIAFVTCSLLKFVVQISLNIYLVIFKELGVLGIVISSVSSSLLFCLFFMVLIYSRCGFSFDFSLVKRLFKYTWPLWIAGSASLYVEFSNRYFQRTHWGLEDVGLYELAARFAAILGILVWQPFSLWWQTERFKIVKYSSNMQKDFQVIFDMVITISMLGIVCIALLSGPTIHIMSAVEFHTAASAIIPLTFGVLFLNLNQFFNICFLATDKTIFISYMKYTSAGFITLLFIALIPVFGFNGAAYAVLMANLFLFLITYIWGRKYLDMGINFGYALKLLVVAMLAIAFDISLLSYDSMIVLIISKTLVIAVYTAMSLGLLVKNPSTEPIVANALLKLKTRFLKGPED